LQPSASKNKSKPKAKEVCGFNDKLLVEDPEFLEWTTSEEGKRIFALEKIDGESECGAEKRRCRHNGWQTLRGEDILMDESILRGQLDSITQQENIIRYVSLRLC
jgi:COMPASS component SPP1